MRGLSRNTIEYPASTQHFKLLLGLCIEHLSTHGFPALAHLDVDKPDEGGIKFAEMKEKVQELIEELGTIRECMVSAFITESKNPPEEQKLPEQTPASQKSRYDQNVTVTGKTLKYDETPAKRNPQTENMSPSQHETPFTNRSIIVPHAIMNSGSASQISDMELYLSAKFRAHPDVLAKWASAQEAKKKADKVYADARVAYTQTK